MSADVKAKKYEKDMTKGKISSLMIANARHTGRLTDTPDFKAVPAEWVKMK